MGRGGQLVINVCWQIMERGEEGRRGCCGLTAHKRRDAVKTRRSVSAPDESAQTTEQMGVKLGVEYVLGVR